MMRMDMIGFLGRDAEVKIHGTEAVLNFSIAHTDKYKDGSGVLVEKTTWVSCSWWVQKTTIAQYLKKGVQVFVTGCPESKLWKDKSGESKSNLNIRVHNLQLLGSGNKDSAADKQSTQDMQQSPTTSNTGYVPYQPDQPVGPDDLPF